MKRIRVDFLIVGAGLAGSVMGFLLKKAGADVLALELMECYFDCVDNCEQWA